MSILQLPIHRLSFTFPKLPSTTSRNSLRVLSSPNFLPSTEQEILKFVSNSDETILPCVRSYENDLSRLTLVGSVGFEQALTAAAADGGEAADEHIRAGMEAMVVETTYPGSSGESSTVSTRLFLPARKVKEKARKLKSTITEDMLSSTTSRNILAMTFRQVVLQQLWNFEMVLFGPGAERNMNDLEQPRVVCEYLTLSASDERIISLLAEVVCLAALETTETMFLGGKSSDAFWKWFRKPKRFVSKDSSVIIEKLFEDEMVENAKNLLESFKSRKKNEKPLGRKVDCRWWTPAAYSKLKKIGGPEFSTWVGEYVPAYRLLVNVDRLNKVKFSGWKRSVGNIWEGLLTHSQMVEMANVLDLYYEDIYALPDKQLQCGTTTNLTSLSDNKRSYSMLKTVSVSVASGILLFAITVVGQIYAPRQFLRKKHTGHHHRLPSSVADVQNHSSDSMKSEALCISTIKKIKTALGWTEDIKAETDFGAWIGELPNYLRKMDDDGSSAENISAAFPSGKNNADSTPLGLDVKPTELDLKAQAQDIASYQVVMSTDGKIVGFQPTSRVAVNHWAANPLANELYDGRRLSPGLLEPGLSIQRPDEVLAIELLMSVNPEARFALARPLK